MRERLLVTGCAGFIGGHILRRLVSEGADAVGADDFSTGRRENLDGLEGKFVLVEGSLCDPDVCRRALRGVTGVLHQASVPSVPRSVAKPLESMHSSVTSTVTLFAEAKAAGVGRVVQAASSSVYGDSPELPKTEDIRPRPLSPYAAAKAAQELYARAFAASMGLDCASLRYFNVFGPRQNPNGEYAAVIPKFITMMLAGEAPVIFGDGEQSRDFTYVDDVVDANLAAVRHPEPLRGESFNVARGDRISLNRLVGELNRELGTSMEPRYRPERPGDVRHSSAAVDKAAGTFGYRAKTPFADGLRETVAFFRAGARGS